MIDMDEYDRELELAHDPRVVRSNWYETYVEGEEDYPHQFDTREEERGER